MFSYEGINKDQIINSRGDVVAVLSHGEWLTQDPEILAFIEGSTEKVRARNEKGHYIKDDPSTPQNEAWTTKVKKVVKGKKKK
tara:strand:+ start:32 stop:280 length:249 start_codon:yes stop_codon:yes gene_type:complete